MRLDATAGFERSTDQQQPLIDYEAFDQPERILTQHAQLPDGRTYLWVARSIPRRRAFLGHRPVPLPLRSAATSSTRTGLCTRLAWT